MSSKKEYTISKNIGLYDPNGLYNNPLTNEPYKNLYSNEIINKLPATYINLAKIWTTKLVYENKDAIIESIEKNQITLAKAGTGVGKTILIPRIALHAFDYKENVICTIPKKILTRKNAEFVAQCMDVKIGEHVGYFYKDGKEINKNGIETKLTFTTTGSLISSITGSDPLLSNYKCVIVDEVHERSVETDLLLLLLKKACMKRKDLKVIIMSATVNIEKFNNYFPKSLYKFGEIDAGSQTSYEIKDKFFPRPRDWKAFTIELLMKLLKKTPSGDIMVFIKSKSDGNQLRDSLNREMSNFRKQFIKKTKKKSRTQTRKSRTQTKKSRSQTKKSRSQTKKSISQSRKNSQSKTKLIPPEYQINPYCAILDGKTSKKEENLATDEHAYKLLKDDNGYPYTRKIVFTTNVAESSLTVDGVIYVIDSGLEYTSSYEPTMRVRRLLESNIAQSAVKQRRGRVGRTQMGCCIHLYDEDDLEGFQEYPTPSIEKENITMTLLDLLKMSDINTVKKLRVFLDEFISPPHETFISDGLNTLYALGAITNINNDGKITPMGFALSKFRVLEPNSARSLIASHFYGCSRSVCDIVALSVIADGRLDSIFTPHRPDKKKSNEWNKKEAEKYKKVMKSYKHSYGDYMSLLKAYKMYLAFALKVKEDKETKETKEKDNKQTIQSNLEKQSKLEINTISEEEFILDDEENEYDIKSSPSLNKWCREHYVNSRKMAKVRKTSGDLYRTLQTALNPYQSRKPYKELSRADKKRVSMIEVNEVLDTLEQDPDLSPLQSSSEIIEQEVKEQEGGFIRRIRKEEELQKLEPNVKRFDNEEDNIMMSLGIGNFINLAKLKNGYKDVYESCFAEKKKLAKINIDSFIEDKPQPHIIMYHELFMSNEYGKFLKLNMVNKMPKHVWEKIKTEYGKFINYCL